MYVKYFLMYEVLINNKYTYFKKKNTEMSYSSASGKIISTKRSFWFLAVLFGIYYLNLAYQEDATCRLDFIQRCMSNPQSTIGLRIIYSS